MKIQLIAIDKAGTEFDVYVDQQAVGVATLMLTGNKSYDMLKIRMLNEEIGLFPNTDIESVNRFIKKNLENIHG